jgi:hypothetical protein
MVNLGDLVKDKVSGFIGVAVARHDYLNGCSRLTVQPAVSDCGILPDEKTFDEPQLEVVLAKKVKGGPKDTGGPERHMPQPRPTGKI